jgi:hypothetical protein
VQCSSGQAIVGEIPTDTGTAPAESCCSSLAELLCADGACLYAVCMQTCCRHPTWGPSRGSEQLFMTANWECTVQGVDVREVISDPFYWLLGWEIRTLSH